MLSSMPLCFNLFAELRAFPKVAARVLGQALNLEIPEVTSIEVEWAPAKRYLNDRTAFDAFVEYQTREGKKGFLGIETKYSELFSETEYASPIYQALTIEPSHGFKKGAAERLQDKHTNQLWRNSLLALSLKQNENYQEGFAVVLSCENDPGAAKAISGLQRELHQPDLLIRSSTFEALLQASGAYEETHAWAAQFRRRYLDLSPLDKP
jgi:hypothetical protein